MLLLPPGGRCELAVACRGPAVAVLETRPAPTVGGAELGGVFATDKIVLALSFDASATAATAQLALVLPSRPTYYARDLRTLPVETQDTFAVTLSDAAGGNVANGKKWDGDHAGRVADQFSTQEWTLRGGEPPAFAKAHPFHLHATHFQIVSARPANGTDSEDDIATALGVFPGDFRDTVPLYLGAVLVVRFVAAWAGPVMVHCHVLQHEDLGMMLVMDVVSAKDDAGAFTAVASTGPASGAAWRRVAAVALLGCGLSAALLIALTMRRGRCGLAGRVFPRGGRARYVTISEPPAGTPNCKETVLELQRNNGPPYAGT